MNSIEIKNLTKRFGSTVALDNINLSLAQNKIYGLLGRNGAGKTTLLNLLTNKLFPTRGGISIGGETIVENDRVLGKIYCMSEQALYPRNARVKEIFYWTGEFYPGFDPAYAGVLAERFELNLKKKVKELSSGYTSIFKAILSLASNADILLFDEPVLGMDANHRELLYKEILKNFAKKPKTVIISTHLIEEIAGILEEVIIIKKGRLIINEPLEDLLASCHTVSGEISKVDRYLQGKRWVGEEILQNFKAVIVFKSQKDEALAEQLDLQISQTELQNLFIAITNEQREGWENG